MNYLVTGVSGFIGSRFLSYLLDKKLLNKNDTVWILTKGAKIIKHANLNFFQIKDYYYYSDHIQNIPEIDVFFAIGSFIPKSKEASNDLKNNNSIVESISSLLHKLSFTPKKIIYISTVDVYRISTEKITEESFIKPVSLYGAAKFYTEYWLTSWGKQNNSAIQILRLGHIFGPGEEKYKKVIPITIKKIICGEKPIIFSDGLELRSYLYIDDCCKLIWKSIELKENIGPINIVSSDARSLRSIIEIICKLGNNKTEPIIQNRNIIKRDLSFDNSKMIKYLGSPTYTLEEGLRVEFKNMNRK